MLTESPWSYRNVLDELSCQVSQLFNKEEEVALLVNEVGFRKKGKDSACVGRQYLGCIGKQLKKEKLFNYLNNNPKRIDYGKLKEAGLLIGLDPIEAANRDVIQKRLKLSSQRSTIEGEQL